MRQKLLREIRVQDNRKRDVEGDRIKKAEEKRCKESSNELKLVRYKLKWRKIQELNKAAKGVTKIRRTVNVEVAKRLLLNPETIEIVKFVPLVARCMPEVSMAIAKKMESSGLKIPLRAIGVMHYSAEKKQYIVFVKETHAKRADTVSLSAIEVEKQ